MPNFLDPIANAVRDAFSSEEERKARAEVKRAMPMVKLAAAVTVAVTALIFRTYPNIFTGTALALVGYGAYEIWNVANNIHEVADKARVETQARISEAFASDHLFKRAPMCRAIFDARAPSRVFQET